jgi:hypothetical protein
MAVIDIGPGATNRASSANTPANYTFIDKNNPANDTGTLDTFEIYAYENMSGVKMGTFYADIPYYPNRDYESIGAVSAGSKQTFTGKNCDVVSGDYLGVGSGGGKLERDTSGYSSYIIDDIDAFGTSNFQAQSTVSGDALSIYATGATAGGATVKPHYYYLQQ